MTRRGFKTLSQRIIVAGGEVSPQVVLDTILMGMIQRVEPTAVGHAKAVAQVDGGVVHASTTGTPPTVEVLVSGNPAPTVNSLQVDLLCVFHGVRRRTLAAAWQGVLTTLAHKGLHVTVLPTPSPKRSLGQFPGGIRLGIMGSLLPSVLILKPCCVLPMLWSFFGGGVGALSVFAPLEPYRPLLMLAALGLLGSAFYYLYLHPLPTNTGERSDSVLASRVFFWVASAIFAGAALSH